MAGELCNSGIFGVSSENATKTITSMIDAGHRYRNIEQKLGLGSCMVLGVSLTESYTPVAVLAPKYAHVRNVVVQAKLDQVRLQQDTTLMSPSLSMSEATVGLGLTG
ncbi:hypothetical protein MRB53_038338 [Persea americana]|nr:hypothetical protein MRB53_038338 [Persea americana]